MRARPVGHPEAPDPEVTEDELRGGNCERRAAHCAVCDECGAGGQLARHLCRRRAANAVEAEPWPGQLARLEQLSGSGERDDRRCQRK